MKITDDLPAFNGVAEGSVATVKIPVGMKIHQIILQRGGTAFNHDHMTKIVLKANGKAIQEFTGSELDDFAVHDGEAAGNNTTGISVINLERPGLLNLAAIEATALATMVPMSNGKVINSLSLDVTISGSTAPTLSGQVVKSPIKQGEVFGGIIKRRKFNQYAPGAAGVFEISDLPLGDPINRIWIYGASDNVDAVELVVDNETKFNRTEEVNEFIQSNGVKSPVANWFVIDPTEKGEGFNAIETKGVQDFRLKLTMGGADTLTVFVEYLGDLSGN